MEVLQSRRFAWNVSLLAGFQVKLVFMDTFLVFSAPSSFILSESKVWLSSAANDT